MLCIYCFKIFHIVSFINSSILFIIIILNGKCEYIFVICHTSNNLFYIFQNRENNSMGSFKKSRKQDIMWKIFYLESMNLNFMSSLYHYYHFKNQVWLSNSVEKVNCFSVVRYVFFLHLSIWSDVNLCFCYWKQWSGSVTYPTKK